MSKTVYNKHKVGLSENQKTKLRKAYDSKTAITLRLKNQDLTVSDALDEDANQED